MKYYKICLSNKESVVIDQADYTKLVNGMSTGSFVQLKNAVINPSFISHILPVSQKEALDTETQQEQIGGYVDEKRGVFVVTKDIRPQVTAIADKFQV